MATRRAPDALDGIAFAHIRGSYFSTAPGTVALMLQGRGVRTPAPARARSRARVRPVAQATAVRSAPAVVPRAAAEGHTPGWLPSRAARAGPKQRCYGLLPLRVEPAGYSLPPRGASVSAPGFARNSAAKTLYGLEPMHCSPMRFSRSDVRRTCLQSRRQPGRDEPLHVPVLANFRGQADRGGVNLP